MTPGLSLTPVTRGDVPALLGLILELARFERLEHEVVATETLLEDALFGPGRNAEAVIARDGDTLVGFALWFHNFSTFLGRRGLYLEDLYVRPEHRGKGYGRTLLAYVAGIAVERDCGRMEWAVLDWNVRAEGFYQSMGAEPKTEWTIFRLSGPALVAAAESAAHRAANGCGETSGETG